jgi:hypothetical protein
MTLLTRLLLAAAVTLGAAGPTLAADCAKPEKPKLPADGKKAKTPEMEAAQKAVQDYEKKTTAYVKCLDDNRSVAQKEYSGVLEQWNKLIQAYNKAP